ncbi:hypothetical protein AB4Y32_31700 [Paraburkholderia phymatum]|uniref:Uncharacterized protein n=1 Tax=Paraburkholderia phymatum TaxID=148447 RepID=A0ACC6U9E9_9BURK
MPREVFCARFNARIYDPALRAEDDAIASYERNGYSPVDVFRSGSDVADARRFARTLCGIDA